MWNSLSWGSPASGDSWKWTQEPPCFAMTIGVRLRSHIKHMCDCQRLSLSRATVSDCRRLKYKPGLQLPITKLCLKMTSTLVRSEYDYIENHFNLTNVYSLFFLQVAQFRFCWSVERLMSEYSFPQIGHLWGVYKAILGIVTIGAPTYGFLDQGANWYIHCMCYPHLSSWAQGYFSYIHHHHPNHLMQRPFGTYTPMSLHNQISLKRVQGLVGGNAIVTNVCVGLGIFQSCIEP